MKKVLFALALAAAFTFVACDDTSDCACSIKDSSTGEVLVTNAEANGTLDVNDFDGDCKDVKWSDLTGGSAAWETMEGIATLSCEDK